MVTRRITFRLYPTASQEKILYDWRRLHCYLYNSALADRKDSYMLNWVLYNSVVFGTNIVKRGESSSTASATYCGGMQQLGSKKRKQHTQLDGISETPSSCSRVG